MRTPHNVGFIRDSLYNCHPSAGSREYARGCITGIFSGLMAEGWTFEEVIRLIKQETKKGISDLNEQYVIDSLSETWRVAYNNLA